MFDSRFAKVCATVIGLAIGTAGGWFGGEHYRELRQDLQVAQDGVFQLAGERATLREGAEKLLAAKNALETDISVLMTPTHQEALKMWAQFPQVCGRQTLGDLMQGDYGCAVQALPAREKGESFPSGKLRADILKDPEKALATGKTFLQDRCGRIKGVRPQVCFDYGHGVRG